MGCAGKSATARTQKASPISVNYFSCVVAQSVNWLCALGLSGVLSEGGAEIHVQVTVVNLNSEHLFAHYCKDATRFEELV
jgi:hypothetical protein